MMVTIPAWCVWHRRASAFCVVQMCSQDYYNMNIFGMDCCRRVTNATRCPLLWWAVPMYENSKKKFSAKFQWHESTTMFLLVMPFSKMESLILLHVVHLLLKHNNRLLLSIACIHFYIKNIDFFLKQRQCCLSFKLYPCMLYINC